VLCARLAVSSYAQHPGAKWGAARPRHLPIFAPLWPGPLERVVRRALACEALGDHKLANEGSLSLSVDIGRGREDDCQASDDKCNARAQHESKRRNNRPISALVVAGPTYPSRKNHKKVRWNQNGMVGHHPMVSVSQ
jgi:hypothetical protein